MPTLLDRLDSAGAIRRFIKEELPFIDLGFRGVSQVSAGVRHEGCYWMTRVGHPSAPKSSIDRLVLEIARARADAILITGAILRAEPSLSYAPLSPAFAKLRAQLGRSAPPRVFILTRSLEIDPAHPIFREPAEITILSGARSPDAQLHAHPHAHLHANWAARTITLSEPSVADALGFIESEGCQTISVEAGPNAVSALYYEGSRLGELLFARFSPRSIDPAWLTEPFCDLGGLSARLPKLESSRHFESEGEAGTTVERHSRA